MRTVLWRQWRRLHHPAAPSPMKAIIFTPLSSSSHPLKPFRNFFIHANPTSYRTTPSKISSHSRPSGRKNCVFLNLIVRNNSCSATSAPAPTLGYFASRRKPNFAVAKCISSLSSSTDTVGWNDVSCSEIRDGEGHEDGVGSYEEDEDTMAGVLPSIPVRAFFFSTRFGFSSFSLFKI